jgi:hypothetical protein
MQELNKSDRMLHNIQLDLNDVADGKSTVSLKSLAFQIGVVRELIEIAAKPSGAQPLQTTNIQSHVSDAQRLINKRDSDMCDILAVPAAARLLEWSKIVSSTWWYRFFSFFDKRLNGRAKIGKRWPQAPRLREDL